MRASVFFVPVEYSNRNDLTVEYALGAKKTRKSLRPSCSWLFK